MIGSGPDRGVEAVVVRPDGERGATVPGAGALGLGIFLASLSMLFVAAMVAYLWVRNLAQAWPPPGAPRLPGGIWVGTLLLLGGSVTVHNALIAIRSGDRIRLNRWLAATLGLGLGFAGVQVWNWLHYYRADAAFHSHLYGFGFSMLTGLHAGHVLGGLIALGVVLYRARSGAYSWAHYPGVRYVAIYWHYLDAVWLALLALLVIAG
jgi:cytochrome c oxidase subunit 3